MLCGIKQSASLLAREKHGFPFIDGHFALLGMLLVLVLSFIRTAEQFGPLGGSVCLRS